jgi:hypothetical protein
MGLVISPAEFLSAPARGSEAFMAARASTVARGFTVAATSMIEGIATSDADTMVMASAAASSEAVAIEENSEAGTSEAATNEENSTAAAAFMVEAASTVVAADKLHFQAVFKSPTRHSTAKAARRPGSQPA